MPKVYNPKAKRRDGTRDSTALINYDESMSKFYRERGYHELARQAEASALITARQAADIRVLTPSEEYAAVMALEAKHADMMKYRPKWWDTLPDEKWSEPWAIS
jgi:hypothetical protein